MYAVDAASKTEVSGLETTICLFDINDETPPYTRPEYPMT
jgi:hypothetical protein